MRAREKLLAGCFFILGLAGCGQGASAPTVASPYSTYTRSDLLPRFEIEAAPSPTLAPEKRNKGLEKINQFQVLVFPHQGISAIPEGKETVVDSVAVDASANCIEYKAVKDANNEWQKTGDVLATESHFILNAAHANAVAIGEFYFECPSGFKLDRGKNLDGILPVYSYPGNFVAFISEKEIHLVNIVDSETYLKGVVPSEVNGSWPADVLKAQAIAARTYSWWTVTNSRKQGIIEYDIDDTVMYQAYTGTTHRIAESDQAVTDTAGKLIHDSRGEVIKAFFSADSGGYTESALESFGVSLDYCEAKPELYDGSKFKTEWEQTYTLAELSADLIAAGPLSKNEVVKSISITEKDLSGRAKKITVETTDGKSFTLRGSHFASSLGKKNLQSRLITSLDIVGNALTIKGKGNGHGVGMSQDGAYLYVTQMHWKFDQILKFYYTGITLTE